MCVRVCACVSVCACLCVCVDSAFVDDVCGCFFMLCFNSAFIVAFMVVCCMGCLFLLC